MAGFGKETSKKNKQQVPKNGSQLMKAAVKAHKSGNIKNAESLYLDAIDSGFCHEIAFSNLGVIYKNTNRKKEAVSIYKRAISINPNFADAYSNLGSLLQDLGKLDQALASTLKSLELNPDNPDAHINLGSIYQDLGNLDQALTSTLKSLELKPDSPEALSNLFNSYGEGDLPALKYRARKALEHNQKILNDLTYIEVISSLGKNFASEIIATKLFNN